MTPVSTCLVIPQNQNT